MKKKKKNIKSRNSLYDINNFYSCNLNKIEERRDYSIIRIDTPKFRELSNKELFTKEKGNNVEDISNLRYTEYHSIKEIEEKDFQFKLTHNIKINKRKKQETNSISLCESLETAIYVN